MRGCQFIYSFFTQFYYFLLFLAEYISYSYNDVQLLFFFFSSQMFITKLLKAFKRKDKRISLNLEKQNIKEPEDVNLKLAYIYLLRFIWGSVKLDGSQIKEVNGFAF